MEWTTWGTEEASRWDLALVAGGFQGVGEGGLVQPRSACREMDQRFSWLGDLVQKEKRMSICP